MRAREHGRKCPETNPPPRPVCNSLLKQGHFPAPEEEKGHGPQSPQAGAMAEFRPLADPMARDATDIHVVADMRITHIVDAACTIIC